jgi:hypothetical protein
MKLKYVIAYIFIALTFFACGTESNTKQLIPPGTYIPFASRQVTADSVISEGIISGPTYFAQTFSFGNDRTVKIHIISDVAPQDGIATGRYSIEGKKLNIKVYTSSSSFYKTGTKITFNEFQVVDSTFSTTFSTINDTSIFNGPGLILTKNSVERENSQIKTYFKLQ